MLPLRLIDANTNRAREALRTMEDVARFCADDAALSGELRALRHELVRTLDAAGVPAEMLIAARDTPGDVGTTRGAAATGTEHHADLGAVAIAAGNRAAEALRTLAEAFRTDASAAAHAPALEALRYRTYTAQATLVAHARLATRGATPPPAPQYRLCVLLTRALCTHHDWLTVAKQALASGADCLQLREKHAERGELLAMARQLIALRDAAAPSAHIYINDALDVSLLSGADGVHLGQNDLPLPEAHKLAAAYAGPRAHFVGLSTHDEAEAQAAIAAGAQLCGVGAMFTTVTKPRSVSGPSYLARYIALAAEHAKATGHAGHAGRAAVPHLAIGGITPENIAQLAEVGCRGVAVSSVVCGSADPARVCAQLCEALR